MYCTVYVCIVCVNGQMTIVPKKLFSEKVHHCLATRVIALFTRLIILSAFITAQNNILTLAILDCRETD